MTRPAEGEPEARCGAGLCPIRDADQRVLPIQAVKPPDPGGVSCSGPSGADGREEVRALGPHTLDSQKPQKPLLSPLREISSRKSRSL